MLSEGVLGAELILCHDCDLPNRLGPVPEGGEARCPRCGALLLRSIPDSIDRTLAFAVAGAVLFAVANTFPFLSMKMQGNITETTLATGVHALYTQGQPVVAALVGGTTVLAPMLQLGALLYVLVPLKLDRVAPGSRDVFRILHRIQVWSMMEVFMLGILVSLVKLSGMAEIIPGIALWSFVALIPAVAGANSSLDSHLVWERVGYAR